MNYTELFMPVLKSLVPMLLFLSFVLFLLHIFPFMIRFYCSKYSRKSGNNVWKTLFDTGSRGEFEIFNVLEKLKENTTIFTNLYIPKPDGTTTEIDLVMLSTTGIYVFESKNYSGWIFGSEKKSIGHNHLGTTKKNFIIQFGKTRPILNI